MKLIVDTDIGLMNDDAWTVLLALAEPTIELVGVTVVAGNFDLTSELRNAHHVLERAGHAEVPVLAGASRPLVHERGPWEHGMWGGWSLDATARESTAPTEPDAVDFIIDQARAHPGEVSILAIGPLTTLALAFRKEPALPRLLDRVLVMGGAIIGLPHGSGNVTPLAEFNVWVDPEAARIVLRSDARLTLVPLNTTRRARFEADDLERIVRGDGPVAALFREHVAPQYALPPGSYLREALHEYALCDPVALACLVRPELATTTELYVDVEIGLGLAYGTTYGYVIGDPAPPDMPHPERVHHMKRHHLAGRDRLAFTGLILPAHPPYWPTPPRLVPVVTDIDVDAFKAWFHATLDPA